LSQWDAPAGEHGGGHGGAGGGEGHRCGAGCRSRSRPDRGGGAVVDGQVVDPTDRTLADRVGDGPNLAAEFAVLPVFAVLLL
jgi:hypothetical protein